MDKPQNLDELHRRLPEIKKISNPALKDEVEQVFLEHTPDYFWNVPASSSGNYHPQDTISQHGLLVHVKRSFTVFERLGRTALHSGDITEEEMDYGRAAILLHDLFKQGLPPRDKHHTVDDHDKIAYNYLKQRTDLPGEVLGCILSHNGPWGEGREPGSVLEQLHHYADMVSSQRNTYIELMEPVPEELRSVAASIDYSDGGRE